jgi:ribosome-associated protein
VTVAEADLRFTFSRSRGPGGQAVNKLSTRAELRVAVAAIEGLDETAARRLRRLAGQRLTAADELLIVSDRYRSQLRNRRDCLERLAALVERAARPPRPRKPTRPSRGAVERRLTAKRRRSDRKRDRGWRPGD